MTTLALEFSCAQRSVAVVQGEPGREPAVSVEVIETGAGGMKPLGLTAAALEQAGLARDQVQCVAVSTGPGSYTGIRAGIAIAQGWQLAAEVKLLAIGSFECMAAQAHADGHNGLIHFVVDAQRNELYVATYEMLPSGPELREPLKLASAEEVRARIRSGGVVAGPEATRWFSEAKPIFPRAAMLGRLALGRTDFVPGEKIEPIYLRETSFVKAPPPRALPE